MDHVEASAAIERLHEIGQERSRAAVEKNWDLVDQLTEEGRQLRSKVDEFMASLDWLNPTG